MGFQVGCFTTRLQLNDRFAIEGFVNGGVYYNKVKYSNVMVVHTTQVRGRRHGHDRLSTKVAQMIDRRL